MNRRLRPPVFWPAIAGLLLAFFCFLSIGATVFANSTEVTLDIPAGYILVQGKTSPNAQVKIYENGNDQPAASVTSDTNGVFSQELPQYATGLVDISVRATDTSGKNTILITKQVAIIAQQTSVLNVILPPTIIASPASAVFRTGTITFSGQTIPNARVKITVQPSTTITSTANGQGSYSIPLLVESLPSVGIYTYGVEVLAGVEASEYIEVGTFVISPPAQAPVTPPRRPFQEVINIVSNPPVPVPEITYPDESQFVSTEPIVLSGSAKPGSIITIYDGDSIVGSVAVGEDGEWQYYFSPYKETHSLSVTACIEGRCSERSRTITITRPASETLPPCRLGVTLESYQLTSSTNSPVELMGTLPKESNGLLYISWGDENNERFDKPQGNQLKATHTYQAAGNYSGYVILNDSKVCQTATYFTVEVTDPVNPNTVATIVAATVVATVSIGWVLLRVLSLIRA